MSVQPQPPAQPIGAAAHPAPRHSVPPGALLMGFGGAVGIWASSSAWWAVSFRLDSEESLAADLGEVAGVATAAGRVTAVASLVGVMTAAAALGTLRVGLRRRLGALAIAAAVVVAAAAGFMVARGESVAADRADLAARAQDMSDAEDLSEAAQEFATGADISIQARMTLSLIILLVSAVAVGTGGILLLVDPLVTRRRGAPPSHP